MAVSVHKPARELRAGTPLTVRPSPIGCAIPSEGSFIFCERWAVMAKACVKCQKRLGLMQNCGSLDYPLCDECAKDGKEVC